jgi:hypothetical protein
MMSPSEAGLGDVMIFSEEEFKAIAHHDELLGLDAAIQLVYHQGLD